MFLRILAEPHPPTQAIQRNFERRQLCGSSKVLAGRLTRKTRGASCILLQQGGGIACNVNQIRRRRCSCRHSGKRDSAEVLECPHPRCFAPLAFNGLYNLPIIVRLQRGDRGNAHLVLHVCTACCCDRLVGRRLVHRPCVPKRRNVRLEGEPMERKLPSRNQRHFFAFWNGNSNVPTCLYFFDVPQ